MRKILFAAVFLFITLITSAQSPSPSKVSAIKKLIEVTGGAKMASAILGNMLNVYKSQGIPVDEVVWEEVKKEANMEELFDGMIPIYDRYYTEEEVAQLIAFYNSPIGKKTIQITPALMQDSMQNGAEWGKKVWEKVQKKMQAKEGVKG